MIQQPEDERRKSLGQLLTTIRSSRLSAGDGKAFVDKNLSELILQYGENVVEWGGGFPIIHGQKQFQ